MNGVREPDAVVHPAVAARRHGSRATTWWGKALVRAVEESAYTETEARRGRSLSRSGAVGGVTVSRGAALASVTDGDALFTAHCAIPVLDPAATEALVEVVAAQSGRVGSLLGGDLPHSLVEHAEESGVELLPYGSEFATTCTCEGWLDPCPHALAVLYQLTWLIERDPIVLLHVRGLPREELLGRVHDQQAGASYAGGWDASGHSGLGAGGDPADAVEASVDAATDAALRAARLLELLGDPADPDARLDHLF